MKKRRKKKSKYIFWYWLTGSVAICSVLGFLFDSLPIGIIIGIAIGGFIGTIARIGD